MATKVILTKEEKQRNRLILKAHNALQDLQRKGYKIRTERVETMIGIEKTHIYIYDCLSSGKIIFQKWIASF